MSAVKQPEDQIGKSRNRTEKRLGRHGRARQFLLWFFRNRETGAITIAQVPNLVLWIVIVASLLQWIWPTAGKTSVVLTVVVKGGLLIWAAGEIARGVNPWRRCLGTVVAAYEVMTYFQ